MSFPNCTAAAAPPTGRAPSLFKRLTLALAFSTTVCSLWAENPPFPPEEPCDGKPPCAECEEGCESGTTGGSLEGGMGADSTQGGSPNNTGAPGGKCEDDEDDDEDEQDPSTGGGGGIPGGGGGKEEEEEEGRILVPAVIVGSPHLEGGLSLGVKMGGVGPQEDGSSGKNRPNRNTAVRDVKAGFETGGSNHTDAMYSPDHGVLTGVKVGAYGKVSGTDKLKWVRTGTSFVDFVILGGGLLGYDMKFYDPAAVGVSNVPPAGAVPTRVVRIVKMPDEGSTKVGRMYELRNPSGANPPSGGGMVREFRYTALTSPNRKKWELKEGTFSGGFSSPTPTPTGLFQKATVLETSPVDSVTYTETRQISDITGTPVVLSKEEDTFTKMTLSGGNAIRLTKKRIDPDGRNLITNRYYYSTGPAQGKVMRVEYPSGLWRHFQYTVDSGGLYRTYSPFGNTTAPASKSEIPSNSGTVIEETDFSSTPGWHRRDTTYVNGNVSSRVWYKTTGDATTGLTWTESRACTPGAAVTHADNYVTTYIYYPNSPGDISSNRLKRIETHDNQVTQYSYTKLTAGGLGVTPIGYRTTETTGPKPTGSPGGGGLYTLTSGTQTTTEITMSGGAVLDKVSDIASGKVLRHIDTLTRDEEERPTYQADQLSGRASYTSYSCCGVEWHQDFDGLLTFNGYDEFGKLVTQHKGYRASSSPTDFAGIESWISHKEYTRDLLGRVKEEKRYPRSPAAGTPQVVAQYKYDIAGDLEWSKDANGNTHRYRNGVVSSYYTRSRSWPLSGTPARYRTRVEKFNRDGSLYSTSIYASADHCHTTSVPTVDSGAGDIGNSVLHTYTHSYSHNGSYYFSRRNNAGKTGTSTLDYTLTQTDPLGRTHAEQRPNAIGGVMSTLRSYYTAAQASSNKAAFGKLRRLDYADGRTIFYEYDAHGRIYREIMDLNNDAVDLSTDRVKETVRSVVATPGSATAGAYKTTTSIYLSGTTPLKVSESLLSADGLYSKSDEMGRVTERTKEFLAANGAWKVTSIFPDLTMEVHNYTGGRLSTSQAGFLDSVDDWESTHFEEYDYDTLGRVSGKWDLSWTTYDYTADDRINFVSTWVDTYAAETSYSYDALGNVVSTELPDYSLQGWTYNALGQLIEANGVQQYPVKYAYDDRGGRLRNLTTGVGSAAEGITSWGYNSYGWLITKRDANNQGADYSYTSGGQMYQRKWARKLFGTATPVTATYSYNPYTAHVDSVSYNDAGVTPGYTLAYDRIGRLDIVMQGANSWDYAYDDTDGGDGISLLLDTETIKYGTFTRVLDRSRDTLRRPSGFALVNGGVTEHSNTFQYDSFDGRLSGISDGTDSFDYLYQNGSNLLKYLTGPHSMSVENFWEEDSPRRVLKQKINRFGGTVVSKYVYSVNALTQRTGVTQSGTAFSATNGITWGYNGRGEVQSADRSGGTALDRFYAYDTAGNRQKRRHGTFSDSGGVLTSFTANTRNQYAGSGAISGGGISASPTYDEDGNQLTSFLPAIPASSAEWIWDAENRLIEAKSAGSSVGAYKYDPFGRRIAKTAGGTTTWFVYDGWNLIAEYQSASLVRAHTWGADLSGLVHGAGGVGGLLSTRIVGTGTFYPLYDGNGNIGQYLNSVGGIAFGLEYDAAGATASVSHSPSHSFPFRFSTKYEDLETGLLYYGYRYLDTQTGRWLNRDPLAEWGGFNLYAFVSNSTPSLYDLLGLAGAGDVKLAEAGKGCCRSSGGKIEVYDLESQCCSKQGVKTMERLTDHAGRTCSNCEMETVELREESLNLLTGNSGHVYLKMPGGNGLGLHPAPSNLLEAAGNFTIGGPGEVQNDTGKPADKITSLKACPETVQALNESIDEHREDWWSAQLGQNCATWACNRLKDAGFRAENAAFGFGGVPGNSLVRGHPNSSFPYPMATSVPLPK